MTSTYICTVLWFFDLKCDRTRPQVEGGTQVLSLLCWQDIYMIESAQRRFTRPLPGFFKYSYIATLEHLKLKSLEERRIKNNFTFLFKNLHGQVDVDFDKYFFV